MTRFRWSVLVAGAALGLLGVGSAKADGLTPLVGEGAAAPAPWHVVGLPKQTKPFTQFAVVELDGHKVLKVDANNSYGHLVHPLPAGTHGTTLKWRWRLDQPLLQANLRERAGDDSPLKICALFDHPLSAVPFVERQVLRVATSSAEEPVPNASVCYVWDAKEPTGTKLDNAFSRRVRMVVARGQGSPLGTWVNEEHDLNADFLALFGDEATAVPALLGISISADADNTHGHSVGHVSQVDLKRR